VKINRSGGVTKDLIFQSSLFYQSLHNGLCAWRATDIPHAYKKNFGRIFG